jgi:hypothetical protein
MSGRSKDLGYPPGLLQPSLVPAPPCEYLVSVYAVRPRCTGHRHGWGQGLFDDLAL